MSMYCYQCQEASKGEACTLVGICGKHSEVSRLQDVLLYTIKGLAWVNNLAREKGINEKTTDRLIVQSLFSTITNANFDGKVFISRIKEALEIRDEIRLELEKEVKFDLIPEAATWFATTKDEFLRKSDHVGVLAENNEDIRSLKELLIYGIKGMAAYLEHANVLGYENNEIDAYIQKGLAESLKEDIEVDDLIGLILEAGKFGVDTMALLDKANTDMYGSPELTKVKTGVRNNPAILISGHDLKDIEILLKQTKGTGVDVYTHCEMLPAHYYPAFKKYDHFVGNYGNAWWKQKEEFESFNGPVLLTTNCLVPPKDSYKDRVYTTGVVGFEGLKHIDEKNGDKDFTPLVEHAKKCQPPTQIEDGEIIGGFAHAQVLALADKVVDAVKSGAIKKFVVMAGCDGRSKAREYYTQFADALPQDNVILTAGCAKFKYNKLNLGDIGGIPRALDAGQCNDSYSLALIAMKLKEVFGLEDINDLPIVYNIAWYEQKAVIVLLALLHLGVKNIHLGPTLPAFLSPNVAKALVENFGIGGISSVEEDIHSMILEG